MITPDQLFERIARLEEEVEKLKRDAPQTARVVGYAANGEPLIKFDGEDAASAKIYRRMRHYNDPRPNDRVKVTNGIIEGTWTNA